jgi:hypothetical protein
MLYLYYPMGVRNLYISSCVFFHVARGLLSCMLVVLCWCLAESLCWLCFRGLVGGYFCSSLVLVFHPWCSVAVLFIGYVFVLLFCSMFRSFDAQ